MPELRLIVSPYHDGIEGDRGLGSRHLARDDALADSVREARLEPVITEVPPPDPSRPEAARVFELARGIRDQVRRALDERAFPLVLAGDCNSCLGTAAAIGADRIGVVWFDAHADFDSPDTTLNGSLDGMGLSILTGTGWRGLRETIPGFVPIPEERVVLAAARALEGSEKHRLGQSGIRRVPAPVDPMKLDLALTELSTHADRAYLHIDLDAVDVSEGRANEFAAPGGVSSSRLVEAIGMVFERFSVPAAAMTAYDPRFDTNEAMAEVARRLARAIAGGAANQAQTLTHL